MPSNNRKNSSDNQNSGVKPFVIGVLTGGLVGAAFALLYAPKQGSETRRDLRFRLDDMTDSINDLILKATGSMPEYQNDSRDRGDRIVDDAKSKANGLMQDADRSIAEARRRAQVKIEPDPAAQQTSTGSDVPPEATNDAL